MSDTKQSNLSIITVLVVVVVVVALALRLMNWISPPTDPPLLAQAEDMIRIAGVDDPQVPETLKRLLPKETFGGVVRVIGLYPNGGPEFPNNSISVVYERDGWRMMQIDLLPRSTIEQVLGPFIAFAKEDVALPGNRTASLINIKTLLDCIPARAKEGIGSCRFTRLFVFELEPGVIGRIAVDGEKVTDGELITIARSMVESIDATLSE